MKTQIITLVTLLFATLFISCCDNDNTSRPVITISELGHGDTHGNDHVGTAGEDLHIDATIFAEGKIEQVIVTILLEGEEHEEKPEEHDHEGHEREDEMVKLYTEFAGQINADFHKHIDIDADTEPGNYHFEIIVVDQIGRATTVEEELKIVASGE